MRMQSIDDDADLRMCRHASDVYRSSIVFSMLSVFLSFFFFARRLTCLRSSHDKGDYDACWRWQWRRRRRNDERRQRETTRVYFVVSKWRVIFSCASLINKRRVDLAVVCLMEARFCRPSLAGTWNNDEFETFLFIFNTVFSSRTVLSVSSVW